MNDKNYYEILNLPDVKCSMDMIKANYKKLCKIHHPDKGGSHELFIKINEAYSILSDQELRNNYDTENGFNDMYMNTIYYRRFGHMKDIEDILHISLSEAYNGVMKPLKIIQRHMDTNHNWKTVDYYMSYYISPGTLNNDKIYIYWKGNKFPGFCGHVILTIQITNNSEYLLDGSNITYNINISLKRSLCGAKITIPHISGNDLVINIKHIIPHGYKHIIKNYGMPIKNSDSYGDFIIIFNIIYPNDLVKLDTQLKELINIALPE
jgi:DnaJ-class molecular chaperone